MSIAALITWLVAALFGFYMLATWLSRGGMRQGTGGTRLPAPLIFGHFALAAAGLVVWIIYMAAKGKGLAWAAFIILLVVALFGFTMFARWIPAYQHRAAPGSTPTGSPDTVGSRGRRAGATTTAVRTAVESPAEAHFPVSVVMAHGLFAATTLVLVLLTALGVGGS